MEDRNTKLLYSVSRYQLYFSLHRLLTIIDRCYLFNTLFIFLCNVIFYYVIL